MPFLYKDKFEEGESIYITQENCNMEHLELIITAVSNTFIANYLTCYFCMLLYLLFTCLSRATFSLYRERKHIIKTELKEM